MYPNTNKKSIFDLGQFGMPNDVFGGNQTLNNQAGLSPYSINPWLSSGGTSDFNFGSIDGSQFTFDPNNNMNIGQGINPSFSPDLGNMPNWGNDPTVTGSFGDAPTFDPVSNQQGGSDLGWNMGTLNTGFKGLATLGSLWGAFQGNKLARKQFSAAQDAYNTNLTNQIKSYNTQLEDRIRGRHAPTNAIGQAEATRQIEANKLVR